MQVRVKTPRIELAILGDKVPEGIMNAVRLEFAPDEIEIREDDDELIDVRNTNWYREEMERLTTGSVIRTYRENRGWSQAELARRAKLIGGRWYVYAIESERRGLGIRAARRLAEVLDIPVGRIIDPKNDW